MTLAEERRERLFWRVFWAVAVLSLLVVAMCRPYMDQPKNHALIGAERG